MFKHNNIIGVGISGILDFNDAQVGGVHRQFDELVPFVVYERSENCRYTSPITKYTRLAIRIDEQDPKRLHVEIGSPSDDNPVVKMSGNVRLYYTPESPQLYFERDDVVDDGINVNHFDFNRYLNTITHQFSTLRIWSSNHFLAYYGTSDLFPLRHLDIKNAAFADILNGVLIERLDQFNEMYPAMLYPKLREFVSEESEPVPYVDSKIKTLHFDYRPKDKSKHLNLRFGFEWDNKVAMDNTLLPGITRFTISCTWQRETDEGRCVFDFLNLYSESYRDLYWLNYINTDTKYDATTRFNSELFNPSIYDMHPIVLDLATRLKWLYDPKQSRLKEIDDQPESTATYPQDYIRFMLVYTVVKFISDYQGEENA